MEIRSAKVINSVVIVVVLAVSLLYILVIKPARMKSREFIGEIVQVYQVETRQSRRDRFSQPMRGSRYRYYWKVKTDSDRSVSVEVNQDEWKRAEPGMRAIKIKGELYPFIDLQEHHDRRAADRYAREMIFGRKKR